MNKRETPLLAVFNALFREYTALTVALFTGVENIDSYLTVRDKLHRIYSYAASEAVRLEVRRG